MEKSNHDEWFKVLAVLGLDVNAEIGRVLFEMEQASLEKRDGEFIFLGIELPTTYDATVGAGRIRMPRDQFLRTVSLSVAWGAVLAAQKAMESQPAPAADPPPA